MINNNVIRNCTVPFPAIQGLVNEQVLGKIQLKNIYQSWQGENINQIKDKHENNPYSLRIGMPSTDKQLRSDSIFFILNYLSYNPLTKDIEKREIIPYRNTERVYIGQSIDEKMFKDCRLFVDGKALVDDLYIKKFDTTSESSVGQVIMSLVDKVEKLQMEVLNLKRQLNNNPIYTK